MRVLLVEDDDRFAAALRDSLVRSGYQATRVATAAEALAACRQAQLPDILLLDLGLPDADGLEVCTHVRREARVPVIVVTARADLPSRVQGLRQGADDYIVKPFALSELLARMEAVLRRTGARSPEPATVVAGDVRIDLSGRTVEVGGEPVSLTRKEFELLAALARVAGVVVERQRLMIEVWQSDYAGVSHTLDTHMATLRSKLGRPELVETVRGVGYRLAVPAPDG
jgi:DNA-binding response OmpR family regulator